MLSIVADLKWFYERFSAYTHPNLHKFNILWGIMIESKLIPRFRSLWCHQRPGKLTTALGLRPRAVVSFPGRWWHHNDLNLGINSYSQTPRYWSFVGVNNQWPVDSLHKRPVTQKSSLDEISLDDVIFVILYFIRASVSRSHPEPLFTKP